MASKLYGFLLLLLFPILLGSCKKGKGAVCNDGWRSHSTGPGTCSWHGGVDHYLNPNEIDIGNTIFLVIVLIISLIFIINVSRKNDKK
jgi:hypothetical protein